MATLINWADETPNPGPGCRRKSPGCKNCFAIMSAWQHAGHPNPKISSVYAGLTVRGADGRPDWSGETRFIPERALAVLRKRKPRRLFWNSMGDLFYQGFSLEQIAFVFAVMACTPQHVHLLLTKEHARMRAILTSPGFRAAVQEQMAVIGATAGQISQFTLPIRNLHLGVSAENQYWWDIRVPYLTDCRGIAGVLWVSAEPMIDAIDMAARLPGLHWIVTGGETGKLSDIRYTELNWLIDAHRQCADADIPSWMKQTGTLLARDLGITPPGEDLDELPPELRFRELPAAGLAA